MSQTAGELSPTAVVTGSNTGIGFEIVRGLANRFPTILCSRSLQRGQQALQEILSQDSSLNVRLKVLDIDDEEVVDKFISELSNECRGGIILVNNAAIAFKSSDPTPFYLQTEPTLRTNYYSTIRFTQRMMQLIKLSDQSRIIFIASQSGSSALGGCSKTLRERWCDPKLDLDGIDKLLQEFSDAVRTGRWKEYGWPSTNYGVSKLAVIMAAKALGKTYANTLAVSVCPGWCKTNMSSFSGRRSAAKGAETPIWCCTVDKMSLVEGGFYYDKSLLNL